MTVKIKAESELEELLSRPDEKTASAMAPMDGDLLILGGAAKWDPAWPSGASSIATPESSRSVAVARLGRTTCPRTCSAGDRNHRLRPARPQTLSKLPDISNVIFMAARKFGTSGEEHLTWAMNT